MGSNDTKVTMKVIDTVTEAVGVHTMLDEVLCRLDSDTLNKVIADIMQSHGLETVHTASTEVESVQ